MMRMPDKTSRWVIAAAILAVAALAFVFSIRTPGSGDVQVQTAEVTSGPINRRVLVSGTVEPARMVEVGSQVSGTIASIDVDFNSVVKTGDVLARLDPASFQARLAEAEAGVAQARAERARFEAALDDARRKFDDAQALAGDRQLARAELDAARITMRQAEAQVQGAGAGIRAAQAAVSEARVALGQTVIRSPIDGIVIARHVDAGQTLAARVNAPALFTIGDLRQMRLLAEVAEGEAGGVQRGSEIRFEIESLGDRNFRGKVAEVRLSPVIEQAAASNNNSNQPVGTSGASTTPATSASQQSSSSTTSGSGASQPATQATGASATTTLGRTSPATTGVVTYIAVIDVDNQALEIPPGVTAIGTLAGSERRQAVRIPNNALVFAPSTEVLAEVKQKLPPLDRADPEAPGASAAHRGYVWKLENNRFVPIPVETGIADDSWTELVAGEIHAGDRLVTAAAPRQR